jgi:hypothetical protein
VVRRGDPHLGCDLAQPNEKVGTVFGESRVCHKPLLAWRRRRHASVRAPARSRFGERDRIRVCQAMEVEID